MRVIHFSAFLFLCLLLCFADVRAGGCSYGCVVNSQPINSFDTLNILCGQAISVSVYIYNCTGPKPPPQDFSWLLNGVPQNIVFNGNYSSNPYTCTIQGEGLWVLKLYGSSFRTFFVDYDCFSASSTEALQIQEETILRNRDEERLLCVKAYSLSGRLLWENIMVSYNDALSQLTRFSNQLIVLKMQNANGIETKKVFIGN